MYSDATLEAHKREMEDLLRKSQRALEVHASHDPFARDVLTKIEYLFYRMETGTE
jgi:hypothetical protein